MINNYKLFKESKDNDRLKSLLLHGRVNDDEFKKLLYSNPKYKKSFFPAEYLEKELRISGISQKYKIPFNLTETEFETLTLIFKETDPYVIDFLFNELLKLNKELSIFKNTNKKFGVISGAYSRYNIDDIKDFIESEADMTMPTTFDLRAKFKRNDGGIAYELMYNNLTSKGIRFNWFPSLKTLQDIYTKYNETI